MTTRLIAALLLPFLACGVQWLLWDPWIKPYVWFLFFPVAFFSAWLGGLRGGMTATAISALLVWYVFIPPQYSLALKNQASVFSIIVFVLMGGLFAWFHEKLHRALRSSEVRFEATFDQAAVGIALVAPDRRWLRVNRKLCTIVGYSEEELLARSFQDIIHPDDLNADLAFVQRMLAKEIDTYSMEMRYFRKDGSIVWVNVTVALTSQPDGTPDYFISAVEEISARKAAEVALRESEERLRMAQGAANVGIWDWWVESDRLVWTPELKRIYGYTEDTFPGIYQAFAERVHPDDLGNVERWRDEAVGAHRPFDFDFRVCLPGGEVHWVNCKGGAIYDDRGKVLRVFGVNFDISGRKTAAEELKLRNEELERFNRASVGRELRMINLKREVNALARELGREAPYDLSFVDAADEDGPA
ncbi:MAG TPA: PAS domain S-box protein [Rhodocyclaceae bacterium]|nr:PAS domain S-box protein [Rhodocyclaceae bacterium]